MKQKMLFLALSALIITSAFTPIEKENMVETSKKLSFDNSLVLVQVDCDGDGTWDYEAETSSEYHVALRTQFTNSCAQGNDYELAGNQIEYLSLSFDGGGQFDGSPIQLNLQN